MAQSKTEICNRALLVLGAQGILNATQEVETARACDLAYDPMLRLLLEEGEWTFATKRAQLTRLQETPVFQFNYAYALPTDLFRMHRVYIGDTLEIVDSILYSVESGALLCDFDHPVYIVYTRSIVDPRLFSELFSDALAYKIAAYIQPTIVESDSKQQFLEGKYLQAIRLAKAHDSMGQSKKIGFYSHVVAFKD